MMEFGEYIGNWGNSGQFCHPNQPQRGCLMLVANTNRSSKSLQTLHRAWVCLALVALCLQAPSLTVHHSHAGGSHAHHHGINHQQGFSPFHADESVHADETGDLNLPHSHRLIWGFDFHQPAGPQPVNSPPGPSVPAARIAALLAPALQALPHFQRGALMAPPGSHGSGRSRWARPVYPPAFSPNPSVSNNPYLI